jgi:hypothetical protein
MTFRTISEANPAGWIHPGIQARHLAIQVQTHIQGMAEQVITAALHAAFGKVTP